MRTFIPLAAIILVAFAHFGCNPNCESLQGLRASTDVILEDYEILLTATPLSALRDRVVTIGGKTTESRYVDNVGLIVKVPTGLPRETEIKLEDPDCLDFYTIGLDVVEPDYFESLENYVPPIPPTIIIPSDPPVFPGTINDAWLSPEDPGYCLWFTMFSTKEINGTDTIIHYTNIIDPSNSFEQATCACLRTTNLPYAQNFVSGHIDTTGGKNIINLAVHRSNGIENFIGRFIDQTETVYASDLGTLNCPQPCEVQGYKPPGSGHMMLLTSQRTGKQLVAFQFSP